MRVGKCYSWVVEALSSMIFKHKCLMLLQALGISLPSSHDRGLLHVVRAASGQ